ncbi:MULTISPECIES: Crp/Fnr family transcriptional regulator [Chryseobacterium group]|uniref:Crp/Fnr family transcriptional regulator n=1 Tax=Chryseobacterium group TaxID=2782232 RepID=UPI000B4D13AB|nr:MULTISPECIES: Crp/Fnr family transcriptional regulator [Chryseobacterium]OWR13431.1 hypothetical protein CDW55_10990 [Chryseobacterium sp. VAUSW3]UFK98530.1 Crp/Fnr family transcriptional regulator [Chryseobacterium faecale]
MFTREILLKNKVPVIYLKKRDTLFREDQIAINLYYLTEGEVKIYNTDSDGKEFLINKVNDHQFLGEPPFLLAERYPANAVIASESAEVFSFNQSLFKKFMLDNPEVHYEFTKEIAKKAYEKTLRLKSIVHQCPHERIINFLKIHKRTMGIEPGEKTIIDVTRKEMANSTGLAIETVIRTVKKMEREDKIQLINHKIYY